LYWDASSSLTTLERSHRFTLEELDRKRNELKESQDEVSALRESLSSKDSTIKDLCASKKLVSHELEATHWDIKVLEDDWKSPKGVE
jgi:chromosome segregation ATPase